MNQTQQFFINILSDHLHGIKTEIPCNVDWDEILKLSQSHQVEGIVYHQCKNFMPLKDKQLLDNKTSSTLYYYGNRKAALKEAVEELRKREISHVIVKGFSVAKYYPIPALRTMGDCDIIVHRKDMPAAMNVMRSLGYQGIDNDYADSWECAKNKMIFELHDRLVGEGDLLKPYQKSFFNEYDAYVTDEELDWSFHFLFLIVHLRKHFMNSGVGIRQFMDLAVVIQNCEELDWTWIEGKLDNLELLVFARSCLSLLNKWFDVDPPIRCDSVKMEDDFYEKVTEKILQNGTFGNGNKKNVGNYERNVLISYEGWIWFRRIRYMIRKVFPSYSYMRAYPGCNYVDGHPYLLAVAWLHRFYYYYKRKNRNTIRQVMRGVFASKESLEVQEDFLRKMGL